MDENEREAHMEDPVILQKMKQEMSHKDKERFQHITFDSIKRNFHKVFGVNHDAMAELIFRYLSNCRVDPRKKDYINEVKKNKDKNSMQDAYDSENDINKARVNFYTFLKKFDAIWLKKPPVSRSTETSVKE